MNFKKIETEFDGLFLIEYNIFEDERGSFLELFDEDSFYEIGISNKFVKDNISISKKGVLRGLHFQNGIYTQAKLIKVLSGKILDIVVDIRPNSKTYGKYFKVELSANIATMLFVPRGFAHGFLSLEDNTTVMYKCDNVYNPSAENGIIWNDKFLNIDWELEKYGINKIILSEKDKNNKNFLGGL